MDEKAVWRPCVVLTRGVLQSVRPVLISPFLRSTYAECRLAADFVLTMFAETLWGLAHDLLTSPLFLLKRHKPTRPKGLCVGFI